MIVFIENLFGIYVVHNSNYLNSYKVIKIIDKKLRFDGNSQLTFLGLTIFLNTWTLKILKRIFSVLQFPVIQQDPLSKNFKFNLWKMILSDGLLTDCIIERGEIKPNQFYTVQPDRIDSAPATRADAIIGSNWLEYGSMTQDSYIRHLNWLAMHYPNAVYFCHPKEQNYWPERTFGPSRVARSNLPIELHFAKTGYPERIISVCSSSLLSIGVMRRKSINVEIVVLPRKIYDGIVRDSVNPNQTGNSPHNDVRVGDLQRYVVRSLRKAGVNIKIKNGR